MEIETGEFICPKCGMNGMSNYLKWQCKDKNRWIFYKKDKGWEYKANSYRDHDDNEFFTWEHTENADESWKNYEGERTQFYIFPEWTGNFWSCDHCQYSSRNFQNFIMKKIEKNNIIEGIIELDNDNKDDILLFHKKKGGLEVYLNNEKINNNKIEYNKLKEGKKFNFKIIFNYNLENFSYFFKDC